MWEEIKKIINNIFGIIICVIVFILIGWYFLWILDTAKQPTSNYDEYYELDYDLPM